MTVFDDILLQAAVSLKETQFLWQSLRQQLNADNLELRKNNRHNKLNLGINLREGTEKKKWCIKLMNKKEPGRF